MAKTMMGWSLHNSNTWSKPLAPPPPSAAGATCSAYSKSASPRMRASPSPVSQRPNGSSVNPLQTLRAHHNNSTLFRSPQEDQNVAPLTANLLQLYYAYFHSAHPLCLPPEYLAKTQLQHLTIVLPVMHFIASFFARTAPTETFRAEAEKALFSSTSPPPKNAFTVQALTLFAIGLHSDNDQERCAEVKDKAIEMAIELGMNMREFSESSTEKTEGGKVLAECWRRTWWELYFLDGLLAGFHQKDRFKLWSVPCTVPLPCEELDYNRGEANKLQVIPEPYSLQQFDDRYFAAEQIVFSSFAYRIDAVRILGQVLAVGQGNDPEDPMADAADTSLVNWGLHLPDVKKELVGKDRRVDEMLFQAHMVINASTIYLHRPKSSLASSLVPDNTSCTPESKYSTATKPIALHTAKAIQAANTISKLITLPCPLIKHTPFFTCVITLAAIVHLSACSWLLHGDEGFLAKERIRLGVGALKTLEEVWNVAGCVLMQVKGVAREVFSLQMPEGEQLTGVITEEEVCRYIEEERTLEIVGGDADYHGLPALDWNGEL
ncbi:hypothetical protein L873DRAFT_1789511 [Choiromyces venosus 120613-1]|uniref:Xylanolytic transcriptional activator regulatory domain-containing protein n=1 Tax=Choiromyces venosus 120613-1 TaxID=1336337 RepID=A0A3N4JRD8_9PEZI|nr:hypothetical protein L873DRAFT_1789511 [Choiromyces venosus 120613-1]